MNKKILWIAYCALVISILLYMNPLLLMKGNLGSFNQELQNRSELPRVYYTGQAEQVDGGPLQFLYRGNEGRWGTAAISKPAKSLELVYTGPTINYGVHTASKSSVAVDDSGYYVGSDDGRFYAYDFQNQLRWSIDFLSSQRGVHGTATLDRDSIYIGNYSGHLLRLDKKTGSILWDVVLADAVGTSPLLVGDNLFVSAEYSKKKAKLEKIEKKSGKKIWESVHFSEQTHSSPSLSEDGKTVFVGDNQGLLRAFDAQSGQLLWFVHLSGPIKDTPVAVGSVVYVGAWGNEFCALDQHTGQSLWCTSLEGLIQGSAAWDPNSHDVIVQTSAKSSLVRLDHTDGHIVWRKNFKVGMRAGLSSPVVLVSASGLTQILAACGKKNLCLIGMQDGAVLSKVDLSSVFSNVPSIYHDEIFMAPDGGGMIRIKINE